jgi:hypothetical protein
LTDSDHDSTDAAPENADTMDDGYDEEGEYDEAGDDSGDGGTSRHRSVWIPVVVLVVVIALAGAGLGLWITRGGSSAAAGPEGVALQNVPDLAPASTTESGAPVGGITCRTSAQQKVKYHIHVHVAIFVNGGQRRIPAGVGIPPPQVHEHFADGLFIDNAVIGGCLYWLHTHVNDGVIHVESPYKGVFTLGQFFDIWNQPLGPNQVGSATGPVIVYENGKRFHGNPRDVPLLANAVIQLNVGQPVVPFQAMHLKVKGLCGEGKLNCSSKAG